MSIVTVHGPYTFGSKAVAEVGPAMATVNPANGLIWTFKLDQPSTRTTEPGVDVPDRHACLGHRPRHRTPSPSPRPGTKAVTLTVQLAPVTGPTPTRPLVRPPSPSPPSTGAASAGADGGAVPRAKRLSGAEEQSSAERGPGSIDPADHTVTEVIGYVEDNPDELEDVHRRRGGRARTASPSSATWRGCGRRSVGP